jgi:amino acid permease
VLDVFPLYVSCFVCHYNLLPVHNDLKDPTPERVGYWLRSTVGFATAFYMVMGVSGSAYGHCTAAGHVVSGNILLDFPENDPLLMVGRMCLAVTLALAFPMLTIPARDIVLRSSLFNTHKSRPSHANDQGEATAAAAATASEQPESNDLTEPLLSEDVEAAPSSGAGDTSSSSIKDPSLCARLVTAIVVFWSAAAVASCVRSIDVVWDLLGSSLSILLSYLIPCGAYLAIARQHEVQVHASEEGEHDLSSPRLSRWLASALVVAYVPLMVISTANAVHNTFFKPK